MLNRGRCPRHPKAATNMVYLGRFDKGSEETATIKTLLVMTTACHEKCEQQDQVGDDVDEPQSSTEPPYCYHRSPDFISSLKNKLAKQPPTKQPSKSLGRCPIAQPILSQPVPTLLSAHCHALSHSYEETLFRALPRGPLVPFTADLVISRPGSQGLCHNYRERLALFAGVAIPGATGPLPFCCRHRLRAPLPLSRRRGATLQLVIRHGETGVVGKVFLLRLEMDDMPEHSQTLVRQKHYYCNSKGGRPVLQHALQLNVVRGEGPGAMRLQGSLRLVFSFNQSATIGGGGEEQERVLGETPVMSERLHIVTEYPLPGKYVPIVASAIGAPRLSPHGAIH